MSYYKKRISLVVPIKIESEDIYDKIYECNSKNIELSPMESKNKDEFFIEYNLSEETSLGEYGFNRPAKEEEKEICKKEFEEYFNTIKKYGFDYEPEKLKYVEYCWYNCCEAPDYYNQ